MARPGDVLRGGGKRLVFLETKADTNGARLSFDEFVEAGEDAVPAHVHPRQRELFTVVSGTLGVRVGGKERLVAAGEAVEVPPGAPHTYWNAGGSELHHVVTLEPALDHETFFESVYGLAREGFSPQRKTLRNLMLLAQLFAGHDNWLAGVPVPLQRVLFPLLAALGRALGLKVWKPTYAAVGGEVSLNPPTLV
ncbi:hypothetical protein DAETH_36340 (plasmid) [Deinococcus aetherius]|uniref:Cupin type-2 domain-containing protein n=1 Tax=Deinococcus aetherius TaxID=200252 RepID=A0ABM8AIY0_9DEIO|nr:cupin domain-containing protein [Deinococcus aetherius]BDP43665.1 hypothetical protein DAETH_36340 [Deinococcus aetherius]